MSNGKEVYLLESRNLERGSRDLSRKWRSLKTGALIAGEKGGGCSREKNQGEGNYSENRGGVRRGIREIHAS